MSEDGADHQTRILNVLVLPLLPFLAACLVPGSSAARAREITRLAGRRAHREAVCCDAWRSHGRKARCERCRDPDVSTMELSMSQLPGLDRQACSLWLICMSQPAPVLVARSPSFERALLKSSGRPLERGWRRTAR